MRGRGAKARAYKRNVANRLFFAQRGKKCQQNVATIDHLIPKCKGGTGSVKNLVLACFGCNTKKANRMPLGFLVEKIKRAA